MGVKILAYLHRYRLCPYTSFELGLSTTNFLDTIYTDYTDSKSYLYPNVAKVGGLQSQGARGEAVVHLLRTPGNEVSGALRLSQRVKKME